MYLPFYDALCAHDPSPRNTAGVAPAVQVFFSCFSSRSYISLCCGPQHIQQPGTQLKVDPRSRATGYLSLRTPTVVLWNKHPIVTRKGFINTLCPSPITRCPNQPCFPPIRIYPEGRTQYKTPRSTPDTFFRRITFFLMGFLRGIFSCYSMFSCDWFDITTNEKARDMPFFVNSERLHAFVHLHHRDIAEFLHVFGRVQLAFEVFPREGCPPENVFYRILEKIPLLTGFPPGVCVISNKY